MAAATMSRELSEGSSLDEITRLSTVAAPDLATQALDSLLSDIESQATEDMQHFAEIQQNLQKAADRARQAESRVAQLAAEVELLRRRTPGVTVGTTYGATTVSPRTDYAYFTLVLIGAALAVIFIALTIQELVGPIATPRIV
jgi:hypothetical protein